MRSAWSKHVWYRIALGFGVLVGAMLLGLLAGRAQTKINPNTQINWPAGCQIYNVSTNTCPAIGSINFRGPWSSSTTYAVNDAVSTGGSTYVSLQSGNLNHAPASSPTYWALLVAGGCAGDCVLTDPSGNQTIVQPLNTSLALNNLVATRSQINGQVNPSFYGIPSSSSTATTGAITSTASSLVLTSASTFAAGNGVMVEHAGASCGTVRGTACPTGPAPAITQGGTAGSTTYAYKTACVDQLGGVGVASGSTSTTTGNATLSATNYNILTFTGVAGCTELAIYRNSSLIALSYAALSGSWTYDDVGVSAAGSSRDVPLSPPASALNDNLVAIINALAGTTATLSVGAGATVSGAAVYHSDTPLVQAAVNAGGNITSLDTYRVTYPIRATDRAATYAFAMLCDTGTVCFDMTGQQGSGFNSALLNGSVQGSDVGLFCARDAASGSGTSQNLNSTNMVTNLTAPLPGVPGGAVGFYNYGCEVENHTNPQMNNYHQVVLTADNVWNVHSPFIAELTGSQSMSQVTLVQTNGGGAGYLLLIENAPDINVYGGYYNGQSSTAYPWSVGVMGTNNGRLNINSFRTEVRGGFIHMFAGSQLVEPKIYVGAYRSNATTAQIYEESGATIQQAELLVDDYGGSTTTAPLVQGAGGGCGVFNSRMTLGIHESISLGSCTGTPLAITDYDDIANNAIWRVNSYSVFDNRGTSAGMQLWSGSASNGVNGILYVPNATGNNPASPASAYGAGYVWQVGTTPCDGTPTWGLWNQADQCPLSLGWNENTKTLTVGQGANGQTDANTFDAGTGYQIAGAASSGHTLCGNGTNYVDAALCGVVSNAVTSASGGSGTGTVACAPAACTNLRGSYTVAGGTFATGTLLTLVWPTTTTAYVCSGTVLNNATGASIGYHGVATATGMTFSALTAATGLAIDIDYSCKP
jgi:hypothetical protein